jgi:hypothetical protein
MVSDSMLTLYFAIQLVVSSYKIAEMVVPNYPA